MNLQNLRTISGIIPKAEKDLPIVIYEMQGYSISDIIAEVEAGTELGAILQELPIMELSVELSKARLIEMLERVPLDEPVAGRYGETYNKLEVKIIYTAGEMIAEIKNETEIGMEMINAQLKRMVEIKARWL